jgi:hypothetical protein
MAGPSMPPGFHSDASQCHDICAAGPAVPLPGQLQKSTLMNVFTP